MKMPMDSVKALIAKMGEIYQQMEALVNKANEGEGMSKEMEAEYAGLRSKYQAMVEQRKRSDELLQLADGIRLDIVPEVPEIRRAAPARQPEARDGKIGERRATEEYARAFDVYLRNGEHTNPVEYRALTEASGGTVIPPVEFDNQLISKIQTMTTVRNLARKLNMGSFSREVAFENATGAAYWVGESTAPTEAAPTFDKITLTPKRLSCLLRVSNELVADADARGGNMSISSIVTEQFARIFAQTEETALLSASNVSGAPATLLGTSGLNTFNASSATAVTAADVISWIYDLPRQYRAHPSVALVVSDATLGAIRRLGSVGGTTAYFWENGYASGGSGKSAEPDRLLGIPVYASAAISDIPAASGTLTTIGLLGAWDYCLFATTGNYELKVLRERYADTNETGYLANIRMDCKLALPGLAWSALRCPAS
jgi:HK97 family phage major capsid protein